MKVSRNHRNNERKKSERKSAEMKRNQAKRRKEKCYPTSMKKCCIENGENDRRKK